MAPGHLQSPGAAKLCGGRASELASSVNTAATHTGDAIDHRRGHVRAREISAPKRSPAAECHSRLAHFSATARRIPLHRDVRSRERERERERVRCSITRDITKSTIELVFISTQNNVLYQEDKGKGVPIRASNVALPTRLRNDHENIARSRFTVRSTRLIDPRRQSGKAETRELERGSSKTGAPESRADRIAHRGPEFAGGLQANRRFDVEIIRSGARLKAARTEQRNEAEVRRREAKP